MDDVTQRMACFSDSSNDKMGEMRQELPIRTNSRGQKRPRIYNFSAMPQVPSPAAPELYDEDEYAADEMIEPDVGETVDFEADEEPGEEQEVHHLPDLGQDHSEKEAGFFDFLGDSINDPIYPGHSLTVFSSVMLIWIFTLTHSITASQLSDLLVLINAHCLISVPLLESVQKFKNFFASLKSPLKNHYFCAFCLQSVECHVRRCPNTFCDRDLTKKDAMTYYIEFPVEEQLKNLYQREDFRNNLKSRFLRKKKNFDGIEDIYDGLIYQQLSAEGQPLSQPNFNISFTWNTDGVPVFKSSKFSIWPLYLMINELPYNERKKKSNMIFYGLWFGDLKPSINLFCRPLLKCLKKLEHDGLNIKIDGKTENIKAFLICGTADLPAKATALNMIQFNGKYSCPRCLQSGRTEKIGQRGHTHIFPYQKENPTGPERSHANASVHSAEALNKGDTVFGLKGPSFLTGLNFYNFSSSTSIDYMHCVLLGITKKLMTLWFSVSNSAECFSLVRHIPFVDETLTSIKPPYHITRRPRTVSDHLKFWKASEFRAWLFFYSVPILCNIMQPLYFFHYCAFVQSIYTLSQDSISKRDIDHCYILLKYFVCLIEPLYGARYLTLNSHSLLHLPKCVEDLGPLFVYSCFPFESVNGDLLKLFHGTQHVETQILSAVNSHQILPLLLSKISDNVQEYSIVSKFMNKSKICVGLQIDHDVYIIGKKIKYRLSQAVKKILVAFIGHSPVSIEYYTRLQVRKSVIHSELYTRVKSRNSYTVKYISENGLFSFGVIKVFAIHRLQNCVCEQLCHCNNSILAIVSKLEITKNTIMDTEHQDYPKNLNLMMTNVHVVNVEHTPVLEIIEVHQIISLCVSVDVGELKYVCEFPNTTECD